MGFFDRLFGRQKVPAIPRRERPLSLQLLFPNKLRLHVSAVAEGLRTLHPALAEACFELDAQASAAMGARPAWPAGGSTRCRWCSSA